MTQIQHSELTAVALADLVQAKDTSIMGKCRRMGFKGYSKHDKLPQEVVDYYLAKSGEAKTDTAPQQLQLEQLEVESVLVGGDPEETAPPPAPKNPRLPKSQTPSPPPPPKTAPNQPREQAPAPGPAKQAEPTPPFDLGEWLFFHPTARFVYVSILIAIQAFIFASLADREMPNKFGDVTFAAFMVAGFVIGTAGIMIAKNMGRIIGEKYVDNKHVNIWLATFFIFDLAIDYSYLFQSWEDITFGGVMIGIAVPLGILAHSANYTNKKS